MSLTLSLIKSVTNYSVLTLIDNTGAYNASSNPGGWGAPNPATTAVNYAHLIIQTPTGSTVDVDIIADLGFDFSTSTPSTLIYNVTSADLGYTAGSTLPDGIYTVTYEISVNAGVDKTTLQVQFGTYYVAQAGVFAKVAQIPDIVSCKKCCGLKMQDITTTFMLLQALEYSSSYGYLTEFTNILTTLQAILSLDNSLICNC